LLHFLAQVTKGWMDPPGKNTIKQDKGMPTKEIFKRYFAVAGRLMCS
jgi:hypothetical protein